MFGQAAATDLLLAYDADFTSLGGGAQGGSATGGVFGEQFVAPLDGEAHREFFSEFDTPDEYYDEFSSFKLGGAENVVAPIVVFVSDDESSDDASMGEAPDDAASPMGEAPPMDAAPSPAVAMDDEASGGTVFGGMSEPSEEGETYAATVLSVPESSSILDHVVG